MASDLLSTIHAEIDARLDALRPSLAEHERLLIAAGALVDNGERPAKVKLSPARPAPRGRRVPATKRGSAAGTIERVAGGASSEPTEPKPAKAKAARARRGAASEAILAALDHGSHTVAELVVVTAMSAAKVNRDLNRMASTGAVVKTEREGKTAYALSTAG